MAQDQYLNDIWVCNLSAKPVQWVEVPISCPEAQPSVRFRAQAFIQGNPLFLLGGEPDPHTLFDGTLGDSLPILPCDGVDLSEGAIDTQCTSIDVHIDGPSSLTGCIFSSGHIPQIGPSHIPVWIHPTQLFPLTLLPSIAPMALSSPRVAQPGWRLRKVLWSLAGRRVALPSML